MLDAGTPLEFLLGGGGTYCGGGRCRGNTFRGGCTVVSVNFIFEAGSFRFATWFTNVAVVVNNFFYCLFDAFRTGPKGGYAANGASGTNATASNAAIRLPFLFIAFVGSHGLGRGGICILFGRYGFDSAESIGGIFEYPTNSFGGRFGFFGGRLE